MFKYRDGWAIPEEDKVGFTFIIQEVSRLSHSISLCSHCRTAIQAGGNVGIFPKYLAKHFDNVHTFEPEEINFACLQENVKEPNVHAHRAALGETSGQGSLFNYHPENMGTHQIREGNDFPIVAIDSLELDDVDLIQLDVEGYEYYALQGGVETIKRCKPVLHVELNSRSKDFDITNSGTQRYIEELGYELSKICNKDYIFAPK